MPLQKKSPKMGANFREKSMLTKFVVQFIILAGIPTLILLYAVKAGLQMQYIRLERKKKPGSWKEIFKLGDRKNNDLRMEAFLKFPLMFAIVFEEGESDEMLEIKRSVKRIHILIYIALIFLILAAVYASKAYPEGIF